MKITVNLWKSFRQKRISVKNLAFLRKLKGIYFAHRKRRQKSESSGSILETAIILNLLPLKSNF
jgi:hypothetical protein